MDSKKYLLLVNGQDKTDTEVREFDRKYPVILSTTRSIKGNLNFEHIYDRLIVAKNC